MAEGRMRPHVTGEIAFCNKKSLLEAQPCISVPNCPNSLSISTPHHFLAQAGIGLLRFNYTQTPPLLACGSDLTLQAKTTS
jgi:hypothetical protein